MFQCSVKRAFAKRAATIKHQTFKQLKYLPNEQQRDIACQSLDCPIVKFNISVIYKTIGLQGVF
jgi:hypothetical protein